MKDKTIIGQQLADLRQALGLSTYHFEKNGLRNEALKAIESGNKSYTIDTLLKYMEILGCEINITHK